MNTSVEFLLALFLLADLWLAAASRLLHCIRLAAWQGWVIGLLPLAIWPWSSQGVPPAGVLLIALISLGVKGIGLPLLLRRAMIRAEVKRELEPLVGYGVSLFLVLGAAAFFFARSPAWFPADPARPALGVAAALTAVFTGLFIIVARRKAITQAIGFLVFENGITVFGMVMKIENSLIVELGILLDVFVLIFVMGIALFQIRREFSHIDADQLHQLNDTAPAGEVKA